MKTFTFRVTQPLTAFYEGRISIKAKSEEEALEKLNAKSQKQLENMAEDWEQNTDNADPDGDIEIQELKNVD